MTDKTKKYPTYKALFDAFRSGELDGYVLLMDNDNCGVRYTGNDFDGDEHAEFKHCLELFSGDGCCDVVEMLQAAGIPCKSV